MVNNELVSNVPSRKFWYKSVSPNTCDLSLKGNWAGSLYIACPKLGAIVLDPKYLGPACFIVV